MATKRRSLQLNRFQLITLALGASAIIAVEVWSLLGFARRYPDQLTDELKPALIGSLLLYLPYVGLALRGRRARPVVAYGALAVLLVTSAVFFVAAASDPNGAIVGVFIWPVQCLVAGLAGLPVSRRG